jgi:hypothetical protein
VLHWKAHPIFQPGAVIVKAGLVQFPCNWVGPSNSLAPEVAAGAVEGVDVPLVDVSDFALPPVVGVDVDPELDLPVEDVVPVVGVAPVEGVVVVPDPAGAGNLYAPELEPPEFELAPTVR